MRAVGVTFYGNFGAGNLGNECTLQAVIEHTLQRWPDARLQCLCTLPDDVQVRHRIAAFRSVAIDPGWSWAALGAQTTTAGARPTQQAVPAAAAATAARAPGSPGRVSALLRKALRIAFYRIPLELAHWIRCFRIIRRTDVLIVPGTQIVSDYLCGPLGWPYDIFKLSSLAALCRVRLVFLSIGVGPVRHPLSRWFIRTSLGLARYRSYRDQASRQYAQSIGFSTAGDEVYPDLAFGLSRPAVSMAAGEPRRRVIALGLKDYSGADARPGTHAYREYLAVMAAFVSWLCDHDYSVRLLIGDVQYDTRVRQDFVALLQERAAASAAATAAQVIAEPALTVEELLRQLADADAVISPRFHNLVLALMLDKPVIALSDHSKLDSLLAGLGLGQYCVPLDALAPDTLISRFEQLHDDAARLQLHIRAEVEKYRAALDAQYRSVFDGVSAGSSA
jgi:polysaccharide pyruvyl transferase WcaK-like protein